MSFFSHVPSSTRSFRSTYLDRSSVDDTVNSTSLLSVSRNGVNTTTTTSNGVSNDGQMPLYFVNSPLNVASKNITTQTTTMSSSDNIINNKGVNNSYSSKYQIGDARNGRLLLAHSRPSRRGRHARATLYLRTPMPAESDRWNGKRHETTALPIDQLSPPSPQTLLSSQSHSSSLPEANCLSSSSSLIGDASQELEQSQTKFSVMAMVEWITHAITSLPDKARNNKVREMVVAATVFLFFLLLQLYLVVRTERTMAFLLSVRMSWNEQLVMVSASLTEQLLTKAAMLSELQNPLLHTPPSRLEHLRSELDSLQAIRDRSIHNLYNKTGYVGPESDLMFLIEEHVGYENRVKNLATEEIDWLDTVNEGQQHRLLTRVGKQSSTTSPSSSSLSSSAAKEGKRSALSADHSSKDVASGVLYWWQNSNVKPVISKRDKYLHETLNQALELQRTKARFSVLDDDWAITGALPVETVDKPHPSQATKLEQNTLAAATEQEAQILHSAPSTSLLQMLRSRLILVPVIVVLLYIFLQLSEKA